ncbi:hypothetical protein [Chryseobacterium sp.]|uniref:hypothetical protein n=1 Tax=Chryseobacterium sp. TaxID=1871047 RepID=UPI00289B84F5|nr:hypothetical protein [Chryseobacterium sp.]
MARTITEIKQSMTSAFMDDATIQNLYGLDPAYSFEDQFSIVSFESVFFGILALIAWTIESIFDTHKSEVQTLINEQKVPNLNWYRNLALSFQLGFNYDAVTRAFINGTATEDQIQNSKVIKYCSVTRNLVQNKVLISMKIATEQNGEIAPVEDSTGLAFAEFMEQAQAAGDNIGIVNYLPDILGLNFKVAYNPLILNSDGMSILNANYPVQETIKKFLKNLPFNGELIVQDLREAIVKTEGVLRIQELSVQSKWIEPGLGYGLFQPITISKIPRSGHYKIEDWTGIQYIIYEATE